MTGPHDSAPTADTLIVRDNPAESRFEAWFNGELAAVAFYQIQAGQLVFTHTEVHPGFEGHGIGGRLAADALTAARERKLPVVPMCPFIRGYIVKHPEFLDLVPGPVQVRLEMVL